MTTRQRTAAAIASAVAFILIAALLLTGWVLLLKVNQHANPQPTVTVSAPAATPAPEPTACAEAAEWYYEHYVALIAESRALASGEQEASPEWLAERIEPAMAGEPEAFAALQECREGVNR